jgi:hypothetical protein
MLIDALCSIAFICFLFIFHMLSELSRRLGEAMHTPPYYTLYYPAMAFVIMAILTRLISLISESEEFSHVIGYVFFSVAISLAFFVTYKYWGWLVQALRG